MAFVIKVSHANGLRRLTWRKEDVGEGGIPFAALESRIREVLQAPASAKISMTYTDAEGDVVTMANNQDVNDALYQQKLNPLRLNVNVDSSVVTPTPTQTPSPPPAVEEKLPAPAASASASASASAASFENDVTIKQVLSKLSNPEIRKVLQSYEPLIGKVSSPTQASAFLESLLRNVATQVATVVKHGADVASSAASPFGFVQTQQPGGQSAGPSSSSATSSRTSEAFSGLVQAAAEAKAEAAGMQKAEVDSVVHSGVSCDLCEMSPIVGPRFKSNKRYNYDLCSGCYEKNGKEEDYQKIEQSMFRPRHMHGPGSHRMPPPLHTLGQPGGFHGRPFGGMRGPPFGRHHHCHSMPAAGAGVGKLDSRFVCDVTMFDGTEVAPKANFTKIWRLRNSGGVAWPVGTRLVHVGGDELGQASEVPLEIPLHGLAPEGEMEVAVDMVAPEKLGRYVSHWRLASPAGPKFGHRIWVVILVTSNTETNEEGEEIVVESDVVDSSEKSLAPAVEEPAAEATAESDPKGDESAAGKAEGDAERADLSVTSLVNVVAPTEEEENVNISSAVVVENNVPPEAELGEGYAMVDVDDTLAAEDKVVKTEEEEEKVGKVQEVSEVKSEVEGEKVEPKIESSITYPKLDVVDEGPITYPVVQSLPAITPEAAEESAASEGDSLKSSMAKLQAMGFTNAKLNLELLEKNNLDLRTTLDDLCAVEEWDPILEELQEMGFYDVDVNRRLMFKNNGSVKRVVKELVQMYRNLQDKSRNAEKAE